MYKNALDNMNKLSEKIQSGEFNQQQKAKRQSMIPRPAQRPEKSTEEPKDDRNEQQKVIDHFMEIREMNKKLLTDVEKGAITGESAEGGKPQGTSTRPKARGSVTLSNPEAASDVYEGLLERGVPDHVAKAFVVNFQDESGLISDRVESEPNVHGTRGKGFYQLTGDRRERYEARYGEDYSKDNQLDFLVWELNNTEKKAKNSIYGSDTVADAAVAIVNDFLRPAAEHAESRSQKYRNLSDDSIEGLT